MRRRLWAWLGLYCAKNLVVGFPYDRMRKTSLMERITYFVPAVILVVLLFGVASLPGSDLHEVQSGPEGPLLRFLLSDPFMHFFTLAGWLLLSNLWQKKAKAPRLLRLPFSFCRNAAALVGVARSILGKKSGRWIPVR